LLSLVPVAWRSEGHSSGETGCGAGVSPSVSSLHPVETMGYIGTGTGYRKQVVTNFAKR